MRLNWTQRRHVLALVCKTNPRAAKLLCGLVVKPILAADGLGELERRVDSGEMAVAFSLLPTSMSQLVAVADAGAIMPPKSTWFEPKLADGAVSHVLD